jgi:hypothetical protein
MARLTRLNFAVEPHASVKNADEHDATDAAHASTVWLCLQPAYRVALTRSGRSADPGSVHMEEFVPDVAFLAYESAEFAKPIGDRAAPIPHFEIEVSA